MRSSGCEFILRRAANKADLVSREEHHASTSQIHPPTVHKADLRTLGAVGAPTILPASALGFGRRAAPSDRILVGVMGTGDRGLDQIKMFIKQPDVQIVAVDVDASHGEKARKIVKENR